MQPLSVHSPPLSSTARRLAGIGINPQHFPEMDGPPPIGALRNVLQQCHDNGYQFVELRHNIMQLNPCDVRLALEAAGLGVLSLHIGFSTLRSQSDLRDTITYAKQINAVSLMCLGQVDEGTEHANRETAAICGLAGKLCNDDGLVLSYHGLDTAFLPVAGSSLIDHICNDTDQVHVRLTLDTLWIALAGLNPAEQIAKYSERCHCIHLKDGSPLDDRRSMRYVPLGAGGVTRSIAECLEIFSTKCQQAHLVVEQDQVDLSPVEDLSRSREYLKSLGY